MYDVCMYFTLLMYVFYFRGEIPDDEDISNISPTSLLSRTPTLAFVALFAILDPPREEVIEAVKVHV